MAIKINFNICDNARECSGIASCPTGAIYWDEAALNLLSENGSICIDNRKCIACGNCVGENGCPVGAIIFANSEEELERLTEGYETDLAQVERLFVERYGAAPIDLNLCKEHNELKEIIKDNHGIILVEEFADWSIQCLLSSIPVDTIIEEVKDITGMNDIHYYRVDMTGEIEEGTELPILSVYRECTRLCQIHGFFDNTQLDEMRDILKRKIMQDS